MSHIKIISTDYSHPSDAARMERIIKETEKEKSEKLKKKENYVREKLKKFLKDSKHNITLLSKYSDPKIYDNAGMTEIYKNLLEKDGIIDFMTEKGAEKESELEQAIEIENLNLYGIKTTSEFKDNLRIRWLISPEFKDIIIKDYDKVMTIDHFLYESACYFDDNKEVNGYLKRMQNYLKSSKEIELKS